jgi:hypothetical protein
MIAQEDATPDYMLPSLKDAPELLAELESKKRVAGEERRA